MPVPPVTFGTCTSAVPGRYAVNVLVDGPMAGGQPGECDVGTHGPRDGQRGHFPPLPTPGTRGLLAFPRGDLRSGIWICAVRGPFLDVDHGVDGKGHFAGSEALPSGTWSYADETGQEALVFPDGTQVLVGFITPPVNTRHTVGENQAPTAQPFAQSQRVKQAPGPFPVSITTASKASAVLQADGSVVVSSNGGSGSGGATATLAASGTVTIQNSGGAIVTVASNGSVQIHAASGQLVTVSSGGIAQPVKLADNSNSVVLRAQ